MESLGRMADRRDKLLKKEKCLSTVLFILSLSFLLQSCSLSGGDSGYVSTDPTVMPGTDQNAGYVEKYDVPTDPTIDQILMPDTEPDVGYANNSVYDEKLDSFIDIANSIYSETDGSGYETFNIFSVIKTMFMDVLGTRGSILNLIPDIERLFDKETGFSIKTSELLKINDTTYRIVELAHKNSARMMGAFDSLFIQYWTDSEIGCVPLVETMTSSASLITFTDYRFFENEGIVSVILKRYSDVGRHEDSYILFLFGLNNSQVDNIAPDTGYELNNGYWKVIDYEYSFYNPERKAIGLLISELSEEDNDRRTAIEITDMYLTINNIDIPNSSISLEFSNNMWRLKV